MILPSTNIQQKLNKLRNNESSGDALLQEIRNYLAREQKVDDRIKNQLKHTGQTDPNHFHFDLLDTERIYHLEHIKKICIDYRLRFLDSQYFKGELPQEALNQIKKLEAQHQIQLGGYKIMAPSKLFKLKDKDDPLLFVPMGNNYFYLVHQWGNDLHPLRKWLVWPFKGMVNLVLFTLLLSYLTTLLVPDGLFSKNNSTAEFWIIFFFMFKWIAAVVIFYGFALGKNFNPAIWNSKYFNA
ncbi:hypothetical protein [Flagellimonas flava]|uniref:hypothetical protein n=1 Tax=Flagellimonas flava TaxID=570519 RepID=UPI003D652FE9